MDYSNYNNGELVTALKALIADCLSRERDYKSAWSYPAPMGDGAMDAYESECNYEDIHGRPTAEEYLSEHPTFEALRSEVKRRRLARAFTNAEREIVMLAARLLRLI